MSAPGERKEWVRNLVGVSVLVLAFGWSAVHVAYLGFMKAGETTITGDKKIIRFAHWQLEGGIVDALNEACRLYEQLHPDVDVEQIEVPERAYVQWVRTQVVGRTAPDLILTDSETCRWWIEHHTQVPSRHPVEILAASLGLEDLRPAAGLG